MARQRGIIPLSGNLGGITFYIRKGKAVARIAGGGFNGKRIKDDPKMHRIRENSREFGDCSQLKKQFKNALRELSFQKDGTLHGRMMKLFMNFMKLDIHGVRGQRQAAVGIMTPEGKSLLQKFRFTPECNLMETAALKGAYNSGSRTFSVQDFDVRKVRFPGEATHMALTLGLLHFDFDTLAYSLKMSLPFYIDKDFEGADFSISTEEPLVSGLGMALLVMRFYENVNGKYYIFQNKKEVGVEVLWVD